MTFRIVTLGCKVNQYETQALEQLLCARGLTPCPEGEAAEVYIVNSCAVTAESCRKSRQAARRAGKDAIVAVCGCWPQVEPEEAESLGVDLIAGSGDRQGFADKLLQVIGEKKPLLALDQAGERRTFEFLPAGVLSGRTRAMLKVQDGCDNFCAYCIIPYARGRVRSMQLADAAAEAKRLQDEGAREIVVTGIEISSYGKDFRDGTGLIELLEGLNRAAPLPRLHLGSLEPRTITPEFAQRLKALHICRHFHLSLQSGCDETLRRMGRRYDTARYWESVQLLRDAFPGCGITTDVIAGFPGETEEEFQKTLAFVEKCAFSAMHIFPYSVRKGTRAAAMDGQLTQKEKKARVARLGALAEKMELTFLQAQVGETLEVLFERGGRGHGEDYCQVEVDGPAPRGQIARVKILSVEGNCLKGQLLPTIAI